MPNSKHYIEEFGDVTFEERPFCDADALALCQVFYMPLEQVVPADFSEEKNFSDACRELFDLRDNKHKALGLMITKNPSVNLMLMADTKRFSEMKIAAVEEVFSSEPAIQYCAGTFILPNGDIAIVYRGTDDTIAGWVEDLDLMVRRGTPAYEFALRHLEKAAAKYSGSKIYLCGHSKGGNIALRSAIKCSDDIRSRIVSVFNYDGPGFVNYHLFNTPAYSEILPGYRHFVPSSSMIGMMLCHDYDYQAVKSSRLTGAFQHDLGTWQIEDGELVLKPDVNFMAKLTDEWLATLIDSLTDNTISAVDTVVTKVTQATGVITLTELSKHLKTAVGGAVAAYKEIDPETKELFKEAFSGAGKMLISAAKAVKDNASDRAANILAERILNN